nr:MAG TPA: hypothetical protein [Caudoviricetes sp.]
MRHEHDSFTPCFRFQSFLLTIQAQNAMVNMSPQPDAVDGGMVSNSDHRG